MMDLSFLSLADEPMPLEIKHADTGKEIGVTFFVLPAQSRTAFSALSEIRDKALKLQMSDEGITTDFMKETILKTVSASVTGWKSSNEKWDAAVGEYTPEKLIKIFQQADHDKSAASLMKQVGDFSRSLSNFTQPEEKS